MSKALRLTQLAWVLGR